MSAERLPNIDRRMQAALDELQGLIRARYSQATFSVAHGEDPEGIYLRTTLDIEDVEDVLDAVRDRLFELQVEEGLPVYVIPLEPIERVVQTTRARIRAPLQ